MQNTYGFHMLIQSTRCYKCIDNLFQDLYKHRCLHKGYPHNNRELEWHAGHAIRHGIHPTTMVSIEYV